MGHGTAAAVVPLAPGAVPVLGHLLGLARGRALFLQGLRAHGDIVEMRLGRRPYYLLNAPGAVHEVLVAQRGKFGRGVRPAAAGSADRPAGSAARGGPAPPGAAPDGRPRRHTAAPSTVHRDRERDRGHGTGYGGTFAAVAREWAGGWQQGRTIATEREMRDLAAAMLVPVLFPAAGEPGGGAGSDPGPLVRGVLRDTLTLPATPGSPLPAQRGFRDSAASLRRLAGSAVRRARSTPEDGGVLALMLAAEDGLSDEEACDELLTFLVTGVETTATTLAWALHLLARHREMADRVHGEARAAGPGAAAPADLPYTASFVQEVLRLHQPLRLTGRRALETVRIGRHDIPRGADVLYSSAPLRRDPARFADPLRFAPDRWHTGPVGGLPRAADLPVGDGHRRCVGDGLVWAGLLAALAALTTRWHIHPAPEYRSRALTDGLPLSVSPRAEA
ncbi:cytochrome P450 [Kitasatospora sp. NPDC056327]|uniref:cytochrome P450 n=1 Tax=Kitasatospora sp. NPDC056327 TaxID=3345785 RepID=UPI0035D69276